MDLLTARMAIATGRETVPTPGWEQLLVYVPFFLRRQIKRDESFDLLPDKTHRIFPEDLAERRGELLMTFRMSIARDLERADCLEGACAVWSQWPGYLERPVSKPYKDFLAKHTIPLKGSPHVGPHVPTRSQEAGGRHFARTPCADPLVHGEQVRGSLRKREALRRRRVVGRVSKAWETLDWIGHDSYLAIGDASIPAPKQFEALQATDIEARVIDATKSGVAVVAAFTEADDNVPVEVQRNGQGKVISLRLCWTADVDELDDNGGGNWSRLTTLPLPRGACSVWDPFHGKIENGYVLDLEPSTYVVEVFSGGGLPGDATRGDQRRSDDQSG